MTRVLLALAIALAAGAAALEGLKAYDDRSAAAFRRLVAGRTGSGTFSGDLPADLPEPARRYLLHAIAPGTPLAASAEISMEGAFRIRDRWVPVTAREVLAGDGFVWSARMGGMPPVDGFDLYAAGEARMVWRLARLLPVARTGGPDVARSDRARLAAELVWLPSALLPQTGARWEAAGVDRARVTLEIGGERQELLLDLGPDGAPRNVTIDRWGDASGDGHFELAPFGVRSEEERSFGGYRVPSRLAVGWWLGTEREALFFQAAVSGIRYR